MSGETSLERFKRIRHSSEFNKIWKEGKRYHSFHFIVIVNPGLDTSRLGLTISRKVGNAVRRNQLKRWVRELFRVRSTYFTHPWDLSIVAKRHAGTVTHLQMDQELLSVFARLETDNNV